MRVPAATREKTRRAILDRAAERFRRDGFEAATTREIAAAAGIAAGTLFNYFPTKEALGLTLVGEALARAEAEFDATRRADESLEERLFALVAVELRHLEPMRPWVVDLLEAALSPLRAGDPESPADALRRAHLERIAAWLADERGAEHALDLHLYWSLYLGVLSFWARDDSERQESTLALLDRAMGLFCRALREE